jgi:MraZ protein
MPLTGSFLRSLDEKQRFAIPKRIRDGLGDSALLPLYFTPGTDRSLALYTQEVFLRLGEQLAKGSPTGGDVRAFTRLFYTQAQCVEIDKQGRVRIPPELVRLLGALEKEIVLLGVGDHLEIWDPLQWQAYLAEKQANFDEIAERAFAEHAPQTVLSMASPLTTPADVDRPVRPK